MREETNVEALRALIHAYPDALQMRTPYGDTPLHLACLRKVNFDVLREVAQASCQCLESSSTICGSVTHRLSPLIARNRAGQSPISIAMDEYQKVMKTKHWCTTTIQTPEQAYSFEALAALVKMLHYGPGHGDERDESLVAACLSLHRNDVRLDPSFIRRALYLYPVELRVVDRDLNYPLHVEASIPVEKMVLLDAPHSSTSNCCDGACHKRMGLLHMILDIYPDAAKHRNKEGKFPLDIMIQNGRPWDKTFAYVVRAHPEVLRWLKNMSPKVVSHMLAQVANGCGIDTLYSLISKSPALLYENESGANVVHERP